MIEGLLRHCTDAEIDANYVDTHGASVVGFRVHRAARLPAVAATEEHRRDRALPARRAAPPTPDLGPVLTRPIRWELIAQQYDQMVKYATALRLGTAEAEAILRRFTRGGPKHPDLPGARRARPRCAGRSSSATTSPIPSCAARSTAACRSSSTGTRPTPSSSTARTPTSPGPIASTPKSRCSPCTCSNRRWSTSTPC